jgi:glutathione-regulated potassium-efflux system protein KefB
MAAEAVAGGGLGLEHAVALLGTAVIAAPLFRRLGLGSVLGYLAAGLVIGPFGMGHLPRSRERSCTSPNSAW